MSGTFENGNKIIAFETINGTIEFNTNEYYLLVDKDIVTIFNKKGISKIQKFFNVIFDKPEIQQVWNNQSNFNIVATVSYKSKYGSGFAIGSANNMNTPKQLSRSFPTEMAFKRAKATALIELLENNLTSDIETRLYSENDEFYQTTDNRNKNNNETPSKEENANKIIEKKENKKVKEEDKSKDTKKDKVVETNNSINKIETKNDNKNNELDERFNIQLITKKYKNGISLIDVFENDIEYFKRLVTIPNRYRSIAEEFLKSKNLPVEQYLISTDK